MSNREIINLKPIKPDTAVTGEKGLTYAVVYQNERDQLIVSALFTSKYWAEKYAELVNGEVSNLVVQVREIA